MSQLQFCYLIQAVTRVPKVNGCNQPEAALETQLGKDSLLSFDRTQSRHPRALHAPVKWAKQEANKKANF